MQDEKKSEKLEGERTQQLGMHAVILTESSSDQVCGHGMALAVEIGLVEGSCTANTRARLKTCSRKLLKLVS